MTVLELKAQHDALQKIATTRDPIRALAEFVWNALDADATHVSVELDRNALGGLDAITIRDDGNGISRTRALEDFENLGASWKRTRQRTHLNRVLHGKEGQGRLRFFSIAQCARWWSVYKDGDVPKKLTIEIASGSLHKSEVTEAELSDGDADTGTIVELSPLKSSFDWLTSQGCSTLFTVRDMRA